MNILIALSRFPYPTDKGDKLRAYFQLRELSRMHRITLVCLVEEDIDARHINEVKKYCQELYLVRLTTPQKLYHLFLGIFNRSPFQVNYFRSSEMKNIISSLLEKSSVDIVYVQLIRLFDNIPFGYKVKYYLDMMDSFSAGMKKRYDYSHWYEKAAVRIEAKRLLAFEQKMEKYFDGFSMISEKDAVSFSDTFKNKIDIIPNGVSNAFFEFKNEGAKKYDIIFTGNMGYHPNIVACKFIVNKILPLLQKKGYSLKVCLAGTSPSAEVLALKNQQVEVTGFVEDIRPYLAASRLFVAPLFTGSGLQNKLLEAMAMGLPTLTTSLANSSLKAKEERDIVLCEEEEAFADKIIYLLANEPKAKELGNNGREYIQGHYDWASFNLILEEALNRSSKMLI